MTRAPTVSVVIPTWNRADWLPGTVDSALRQTHPPAEIIVVDDGSTDQTEAVARALPDPVRYVRQENAGVGAARNAGARLATGDFLAFLDCEDLWEPRKLEIQLAAVAAAPEVGWVISDCIVIDPESVPVSGIQGFRRVFAPFERSDLSPDEYLGTDLRRLSVTTSEGTVAARVGDLYRLLFLGNIVLPSSALVRRHLFERLAGFDPGLRLAEETEFFHRLSAVAPAAVIMTPLVRYRVGLAGTLTNPANTVTLVRNALESGNRARALRKALTAAEEDAWLRGRRALLERLAYALLAGYEPGPARAALAEWRSLGAGGPRYWGLRAAASLPPAGLRAAHRLKQALRR